MSCAADGAARGADDASEKAALRLWAAAFPSTPLPAVLRARLPSLHGAAAAQFLQEAKQGILSPQSCNVAKVLCRIDTALVSVVNSRHTGRGPKAQVNEYVHEKQLYKGSEIMMPDLNDDNLVASFLPDSISKQIPYGTQELRSLLHMFQYHSETNMSKNIIMSLNECEAKSLADQKWVCARSLNDLVAFVRSSVGSDAELVWSNDATFSNKKVQVIDVQLKYAGHGKPPVSCHNFAFPHALFYCHYIQGTKVYHVTLKDTASGITKSRIAICHALHSITTTMLPANMSPNEQDCHWIYGSHLMWVPKAQIST
ncbi:hypothetical protein GOP47_0011298 [Adiantum capillus-veneris]|nr:hypothetical protein GOP47_0011298 [Adiantum capillus-veneris]